MTQSEFDATLADERGSALEDEFWGHEPARRAQRPTRSPRLAPTPRLAKTPRPARPARHAQPETTAPGPLVAGPRPPVDPLLRRAGLLALGIGLLIPAALVIRDNGGSGTLEGAATVAYGGAPTTASPTDDATGDASGETVDYPMVGPLDNTDLPTITPPGDSGTSSDSDPSAPPARTESASASVSCAAHYDVRSGDSWSLIASRASVTLDRLLAANSATASTVILVGQQICLPPEAKVSALTSAGSAGSTATKTSVSAPPTTLAPAPVNTYSRDQVIRIIREEWPDDLEDTAIMIADRESHLNPSAQNWCCVGLFQMYWNVHKGWLAALGITDRSQMFDPRTSARAGYALYKRSNSFGAWGL